jgi:arylsulfatase A-like enzyme
MQKSVDDMVERIFQKLEATGQADNTLAVYISDNGFMWSEHGVMGKHRPYLESVRVPMLMRWPNRVASSTDSSLVANIDLAPTALAAAEPPVPQDMDGLNLLAGGLQPRNRLLLEMPGWASLVMPNLQYTEYDNSTWGPYGFTGSLEPGSGSQDPVREYYDLTNDSLELTNLLHDGDPATPSGAMTVSDLHDQLVDDRDCTGHAPAPGACP